MSPSPSPDRYSFDKRIQDAQGDIDRLDNKLDSKIDLAGLSQEQKDALKKAYIDKVNTVQGKVRRSFEKIDVQRDLRSPEWRKWEEQVLGVETDLFLLLGNAYEKMRSPKEENIAVAGLAHFNLKVDELLNGISALDEKNGKPKKSKETNEMESTKPRSTEEVFREWNVQGSHEDITAKARKADEHYGAERIRELASALSLYESLPAPLKEKFFKTTAPLLRQQIAGQLANGTFEQTPLSSLLTEDFKKIEEQILLEREEVLDHINALSQEVHDLEDRTHKQIAQLCKTAKEDVADDTIGSIVAWVMNTNGYPEIQAQVVRSVKELAEEVQSRQKQMNDHALQLKQIEYAFNALDTTAARNDGKSQQEAQLLFRSKIGFGQDIQLSDSQLQLLRPAQQQLLLGRHNDALRTSIDGFNSYVQQNPDLDTLDRTELLRLTGASKVKPDGARFENVDLGFQNPFSRFDVHSASFSRLRPTLGLNGQLNEQPRKITVLRELGHLKQGGELILIELPKVNGGSADTAVAYRDADGTVRLQDGTVLEDPRELRPMRINSESVYGRTVYVSPETESFLNSNVGSRLDDRVILREGIRETKPIAPFAVGPIYTLDKSQLQMASRRENGEILLLNTNGNLEQTIDAERLRKESTEQGQDVLRSIDQNPLIQDVTQRAGTLQGNMQNMQMMLQTAMSGEANVGDAFIGQLRDYARPMLKVMEDPTTKQQVLQAKELLQSQLQRVGFGNFLGKGMEREIQSRIDALDGYIKILDDNRMLHGLQTAMEVRPNTWASWLSKDGLIMLGAIIAAVIAIGLLTVFTGGAGLIAISAVGAAAGIAGAEGTKELLFQYHNQWGGASTGQYRYTDGSRVGNYFREQKLFDPQTGEFVEMGFLKDVALPYAQEFIVSFATTALALGAGQAAGSVLSRLAQNSKAMQALAKNSGIANSIMKRLSGLSDEAVHIPGNIKEFAKNSFKEILDELNDELVLEAGVAQGLMRIDKRLAFLATFIVATGKGFKPLAGGQLAYDSAMSTADVRTWAEGQGHTVVFEQNGVFDVKTFDGLTLILKPAMSGTRSTEQGLSDAQQLAQKNDVTGLKEYLKVHDVDDETRIKLAGILLKTSLSEEQEQALLEAHKKEGEIDALTQGQKVVKGLALMRNEVFSREHAQILLDAGLAGKKTPPVFRYNAENKLVKIEANGITLKNGMEVVLTASGESSIKSTDGKGATIPIGKYVIEFKPDKNGKEIPTLKPLNPNDKGGNYTVDFWKTDFALAQPESIIKKANAVQRTVDTKTHIEYGKKTWTTAQTVRDSLQNHLDAQTQHYFDQIVSTVLDTNQLQSSNLTEEQRTHLNEFCYALFRYAKSCEDLSPEAKREFQSAIEESGRELPINKAFMSGGSINLHALESALMSIEELRPTVRYRVVDTRNREDTRGEWVTLEQLQQPPYNELQQTPEGEEACFQITAVDVLDQGSGFDAKLTEFYKSTKTEAKHLRGRFGEGVKMNYTHLLRNGAKVKMRSRFSVEGEAREGRVWQRRPYLGEDGKVYLKSIEVQLPSDAEKVSGSSTLIDIVGADPEFQEAFRKNIDPRNPEGLAINCLAYCPHKYYYPVSKMDVGYSEPATLASVGVSLENDPKYQYLQGLRIEGAEDYMTRLFSYDVLDPTLLKGRDRNQIKDEVRNRIHNFWRQAESPVLLETLVKRALVDLQGDDSGTILETNALKSMMAEKYPKNPQQERTQAKLYEILPDILGLRVGEEHVIVSNKDAANEKNADLLRILENKGYKIIYVGGTMAGDVFERANEFYDGKYHLYTLEAARGKAQESTTFLSPDHKDVIRTQPVVDAAKSELIGLLAQSGITNSDIPTIQYLETIDPEVEKPVEAVFDEETKTFHIIVRPDLMLAKTENGQGMAYWKRRIQIEMLSTINRSEAFPDRQTALQHAQQFADLLVENTLHDNAPDVRAVPKTFNHVIDQSKEKGAMDMLYGTEEELHDSIRGWHAYEQVSKFECTLNVLQQVAKDLKSIPPRYRSEIEDVLKNRIVVENGEVGYFTCEYSADDESNIYTFHREKISSLKPAGQLAGDNVYQVEGKIFIPFNTPIVEGTVVTDQNNRKYLYHNGELLHYDLEDQYNPRFERAELNHDWCLHNGCFSLSAGSGDAEARINHLKFALDHLQFDAPESGKRLEMKILQGTVETPLPVEYGKDEWNNPVRVFQDILQNHIDASPNGNVELLFEVLRNGKRIWVTGIELTDTFDSIVGFRVRDNGGGYPPDDLGTMGKSSKKSPLFAGKYGEGQKMVAAAAARKGLDLRFSSVGNYEGTQQRWVAAVGTKTEEIVVNGGKTTAERVVFNVKSQRPAAEETYSSETILRLPEGSETSVDPELQKWFSIIDPRNTDERGNGGLGRYIINLREGDNSNVIDLGYMRILLDEPGAVYENGLLIGHDPQKNALGYDVPEVVSTRERNAWNEGRLRAYVSHALEHTTDARFIDTLVKELKTRYLENMTSGQEAFVHESDLNVGKIFQSNKFIASRPYWRAAFASHFPGYFVHSDGHMNDKIRSAQWDMKYYSESGDAMRVEDARQRINDTHMVVANMGHIPQDKILRVYQHEYEGYAKVLPTAEEYLRTITRQEVPISDEVLQQLRGIVAASASEIKQVIDTIEKRENAQLRSIVSSNEPSSRTPVEASSELARLREQLNFWTSAEQLATTPHSLFVAPSYSGYHGLAEPHSIGINENLLLPENRLKLVETIRHELLHSLTGLHDYTPEFVMLLLELADQNRQVSQSPKQPKQAPRHEPRPPPPPPQRR